MAMLVVPSVPLESKETPGTTRLRSSKLAMRRDRRSPPLSAVMLIGTVLMSSARFCAVTTTSLTCAPSVVLSAVSAAGCAATPSAALVSADASTTTCAVEPKASRFPDRRFIAPLAP